MNMILSPESPDVLPISTDNPCLTCGACCGYYRVSFYWGEANDSEGGTVPVELTERVGEMRLAMKGTVSKPVRCVALVGQIGECVSCSIHPQRSSACREFDASWEHGVVNPDCDRARAVYGLPPLSPREPERGDDPTPVTPKPGRPRRREAA